MLHDLVSGKLLSCKLPISKSSKENAHPSVKSIKHIIKKKEILLF